MSNETSRPRAAAVWIGLGAAALIIGSIVRVPGLDTDLLDMLVGSAELGAARVFGMIGMSVVALLGVRLLAALLEARSKRAWSIAFVLYLALTALQSAVLVRWAESAGDTLGFALVVEPGWSFRLTAVLTWTAGASILWFIADRIDATRSATGALAIAALASMLRLVESAAALGEALGDGRAGIVTALAFVAEPAMVMVMATLVTVRAPPAWPVTVAHDLELRSRLDVIAAPLAIACIAGDVVLGAWIEAAYVTALRTLLVIAGTVGLVLLWRARVESPGPRRAWPIAVASALLVAVIAPLAFSLVASGGLARMLEPGPLAGEARFTLTLRAVDRFEDGEAAAMVARIESLGASAELIAGDTSRVTLRVEDAVGPEEVLEALRPRVLALHLVEPLPASVTLPPDVRAAGGVYDDVEGPCPSVRALAPRLGCMAAVETRDDDSEPSCVLHCLEREPVLTGRDVVDATVVTSEYDGRPQVTAALSDEAAERFERVTRENISRRLAIVVDGEVVSAPVIRSAIPGGRIQIDLGAMRSLDELHREASALATALHPRTRLDSAWTYESLN